MQITREVRNFIIVTAVFAMISFVMSFNDVSSLWLWGLLIAAWAIADWIFAKGVPLKAWHWAVLIVGLSAVNIIISYVF